jgi:hypothetical protein
VLAVRGELSCALVQLGELRLPVLHLGRGRLRRGVALGDALRKKRLFFQRFLCLSRACLGKVIAFRAFRALTWLKQGIVLSHRGFELVPARGELLDAAVVLGETLVDVVLQLLLLLGDHGLVLAQTRLKLLR